MSGNSSSAREGPGVHKELPEHQGGKKKRFLILAGSEQGSPGWDSRSFRDSCALQAAQNSQGTNPSAQAVPRASPLHGMQIQVNQSFGSSLCSFGIRRSFPEGILALECSGNSWDFFFFQCSSDQIPFFLPPSRFFCWLQIPIFSRSDSVTSRGNSAFNHSQKTTGRNPEKSAEKSAPVLSLLRSQTQPQIQISARFFPVLICV